MDAIGSLIGALIFFGLLSYVIRLLSGAVRATGRTIAGKGSFAENFEFAFKGMAPLEGRLSPTTLNSDGSGPLVMAIQIKGLFPSAASTFETTSFFTSVFDETSGELVPVLSYIDDFQERNSRVFQYQAPMGRVLPNQGFITWVRAGVVIPDLIQPPYSGNRKIVANMRMMDASEAPLIVHGFHDKTTQIGWQRTFHFEHSFKDKGYLEAAEHRDKAIGLAISLGLILAMPDGTLNDAEGRILKKWIEKMISSYSGEHRITLKDKYNAALIDSYRLARNGQLSLTGIVTELNQVAEKSVKYDAIELCFDIMTVGGTADTDKLRVIRLVAEVLKLDLGEIEKIKDQHIVNLGSSLSEQASVEMLLGIKPDWNTDQVNRHLRSEFQKWNNRLNVVQGQERESAQQMLDLIAEARRKYG